MSNFLRCFNGSACIAKSMSTINSKPKIDLFYDVMSPYAWFAFEVLQRYKNVWNIDLKLKPVLLGGIMQLSKNQPPVVGAAPVKVQHFYKDIIRCAEYYGLDLIMCKDTHELMSYGSLAPMRCVTTFQMYYPEYLENISRTFWLKRWHNQQDFTTTEALMDVIMRATKSSGKDFTQEVLSKMQSQDVKLELKNKTIMAAEKYGAFGVPSMVVHNDDGTNELYFGADRIPLMASKLGLEWKGPKP